MKDWRNIERAELDCSAQFVVLHGRNGVGKTNILEAVYFLSSLRSFRDHARHNLIRKGTKTTSIEGHIRGELGRRRMLWSFSSRGRFISIDSVPVKSLSSWFSQIRSILFAPESTGIITGPPERRRSFLDRARFIANPSYLISVREYIQILDQKRALLAQAEPDQIVLELLNERLIDAGIKVILQRQKILEELRAPFQKMYATLTEGKEVVGLSLVGLAQREPSEVREYFSQKVEKMKSEEVRQRRVLVGPHRDDLSITINGFAAKKFASQGQARSIAVALKLAELEASRERDEYPIFLMDDLSSELDRERTQRLISILSQYDNQIWITTTDPSYLGQIARNKAIFVRIEDGKVGI